MNEYEQLEDFNSWFSLFLEEKELSEAIFEFEDAHQWHFFPIGVINNNINKILYCNI
ncbi:MAG: hypothetical protein ACFE9S_20380 [Candidatus Hermodarchaeota archaeon]